MVARQTQASTYSVKDGSGFANHTSAVNTAVTSVQAASMARRRPPLSASAPRMGDSTAMHTAAMVCIQPHCAWPVAGSGAMPWLK